MTKTALEVLRTSRNRNIIVKFIIYNAFPDNLKQAAMSTSSTK